MECSETCTRQPLSATLGIAKAPGDTMRSSSPSSTTRVVLPHPRVRKLRRLARFRRRFGHLTLLAPVVLVLVTDILVRGNRLLNMQPKYWASYAASLVESAAFWAVLLLAASDRKHFGRWPARVALLTCATLAVGGQIYFHGLYATYINLDATLFTTGISASVSKQVWSDTRNLLLSLAPATATAALLIWLGRLLVRPRRALRRWSPLTTPLALGLVMTLPCSYRTVQGSTPDVIYMHALGGLIKAVSSKQEPSHLRPGRRSPPALPVAHAALPPLGTRSRNVLLVLTESVRADANCSAHQDECPPMPELNAAVPHRIPLHQLRANSSATAIELSVIWSGLEPNASREALLSAPLLFDYAHAAGIESAYWSSHHPLFANTRLYIEDLPTKKKITGTELDSLADVDTGARDELLTARAKEDLPVLKEPFFAVVHFGNTHLPYRIDPNDAPFQPYKPSKAKEDNLEYRNYYLNAVYLQQKTMANLVTWIRQQPFGARTVIAYTSDHGEAFLEHGQVGHTGSLYEEEIHVPGWIDAPIGTLSDAEETHLRGRANEFVFHTDLFSTLLDLMGLLDEQGFASYLRPTVGQSWLRPKGPAPMLALTNCAGIWGCVFENWAIMRANRKLLAREWDTAWQCHDVLQDPKELQPLPLSQCDDLAAEANRVYGGLPSAH